MLSYYKLYGWKSWKKEMLTKALTGSEAMTNNNLSKKGDFGIREHSRHILKAWDSGFT